MRRYEILLPLRFNDTTPVADEQVGEAIAALRDRFGAVSAETQAIQGLWQHAGHAYKTTSSVFVDVPDTEKNRAWFIQFKERLKRDFRQLDVWITTHPIEVL